MGGDRVEEAVEVACEHILQLIEGEADPVVRYPALGKIVGADPLAPVAGPHLFPSFLRDLLGFLLLHFFLEPRPQHPQRFCLVLVLRLLVLAGHDEA